MRQSKKSLARMIRMIFRKPNFQGDYFVHAIDIVDKRGKLVDHIGGINNVVVANVAFEELRHYHSKNDVLILRDGARVMRRSRGFDIPSLPISPSAPTRPTAG